MFELLELKRRRAAERISKSVVDSVCEVDNPTNSDVNFSLEDNMPSPFTYVVEVSMLQIYNEQVIHGLEPRHDCVTV